MLDDTLQIRQQLAGSDCPPGAVLLVGAGPGDPDLLTLKAARALREATLVLYDHLVSPEVLGLINPQAHLICVGKLAGRHTLGQDAIVELMLGLAGSGRSLVRLKGGDPYVFGRGGEEAQALAAAGIPFEVVPGISAAQGAAASAGIPLTHRDHATSVVLVTGHGRADAHGAAPDADPQAPEVDWAALARPHQTLVIYMGLGRLASISAELMRHGLAPQTPAALIERASQPGQRTVTGTLQSLPELAVTHAVKAPALIIVGGVVSLHHTLRQTCQLCPPTAATRP
ncbi:MAG: uroporphyrinogen-III C-methyltransferase [Leptothrix sp. (in: b-proteobacteria)]